MSFLKRLFSSDRRAALKAEATGDFELAAERYALAGEAGAVVRMHLARADRADTRSGEIEALRDALYWARDDEDLLFQARPALALALMAQSEAEGVTTERDRERVREAAQLFLDSNHYGKAGDAYSRILEHASAVKAYRAGGLVSKLEHALTVEENKQERGRSERHDYADYEMFLNGGQRDEALASLRSCIEAAENSSEYRRKLDELETRLITTGTVRMRSRRGALMTLATSPEVFLGRDPTCDLILRSSGTSRRHARVSQSEGKFRVSDAGSKNGTKLGGMPIASDLPLEDKGVLQLGDALDVQYEVDGAILHLSVASGLDAGAALWVADEEVDVATAPVGVSALLQVRNGRPFLRNPDGALELNDAKVALAEVQLIHGDVLVLDGVELEVL